MPQSTPENVQAALDRVAAGHERAANIPREELLRLRRETLISTGLTMFNRVLNESMAAIQKNGSKTANLEHYFELALSTSHKVDVYVNAQGAALEKRLQAYIDSVGRQLHFATLRPINGSPVEQISRKHYIAARAQFLEEMSEKGSESLTMLEFG